MAVVVHQRARLVPTQCISTEAFVAFGFDPRESGVYKGAMPIAIMLISSVAIIGLVKYGLVPGIDRVSAAWGWSAKARGKATGYATSVPELVTLVAAGLSGVWDAGLWNIASSNILNLTLAVTAVVVFRRGADVLQARFAKELTFAALGIGAPLVLMQRGMDTHWAVIPALLVLFVAYLLLDRSKTAGGRDVAPTGSSGVARGLLMIVVVVALLTVAADHLGSATRAVVFEMGVPASAAGWILGLVTSLPEAVTFFSAFSSDRVQTKSVDRGAQMQELLDNLAASNMSNSGLIYPVGLAIFLMTTGAV